MNYYYLDAGNQPVGPLPLDEIRQRAAAGQIPANPLVAAVGTTEWQPLPGLHAAPTSPAGLQFDQLLSNAAAGVVQTARDGLPSALLEGVLQLARTTGQFLVTASGILGLAYALYAGIKHGSAMVAVSALLLLVGLAFAQFAARRFFEANVTLLTPTRISSVALLDCLALLALIAAITTVVSAAVVWIKFGVWQPIIPAVLAALYWLGFGALALHPETVRVEVGPSGAGEQVVGLLAFFCKSLLKLVPLFFLTLVTLGFLVIALSFFDHADYVLSLVRNNIVPLPQNLDATGAGFSGLGAVVFACLLPLLAHLLFIAVSLPLDLWRALLSVPEKLDALKR